MSWYSRGGYWNPSSNQLRDPTNGKIVLDPVRFPSGLKAIIDFVHSKGMKFGMYTSGTEGMCDGHTHNASQGREMQDAQDFADQGNIAPR